MVALLQTQNLAFVEHGPCVADDPKLKVHGRRHAGVFQKLQGIQPPNYPPSPTQATNLPRFLVLSLWVKDHLDPDEEKTKKNFASQIRRGLECIEADQGSQ